MANTKSNSLAGSIARSSDRLRRWVLFGIVSGIFFAYVASFLGVVGANDGSHFAAVQALATRGTFRIDDGLALATSDVAAGAGSKDDGTAHLYSNKPPGTAVLAVPFYWLGELVHPLLELYPPPATREPNDQIRMRRILYPAARDQFGYQGTVEEFVDAYQRAWPRQNAVNLLPALAGTACCALVYLLARRLGAGFVPAVVTMVLAGLGTLEWRYSTALFAHIFSALFLLGQLYLLLTGRAWRSLVGAIGFGLLTGYSGTLEYQALLTAPLVGLFWIVGGWRELNRPEFARRLGAVVVGGGVPLVLLAIYHWHAFGSPWTLAPTRSLHFEQAESVGGMLTGGSVWQGLDSMLLGNPHAEQQGVRGIGLLTASPFLVLAVIGWFLCPKGTRWFALLVGACVVAHVALMARVWSPMAGATFDARYLVRIVPLVAVGFAVLLERVRAWQGRFAPRVRPFLYVILVVLAVLSVVNTIDSVGKFERHDILLPSPASRVDLSYLLGQCWMNAGNPSGFFQSVIDLFKGVGYVAHACFANLGNWPLFAVAVTMLGIAATVFGLTGARPSGLCPGHPAR